MTLIQNLEGKVSSHAMDLIKAQQSQAMAYNIKEHLTLENGINTYIAYRPVASEALALVDERITEDYGLKLSLKRHRVVTPFSCSCQFHSC